MRYVSIVLGVVLIAGGLLATFAVPLGGSCLNLTAWDLWRLHATACAGRRNGMTAAAGGAVAIGVVMTVGGAVAARKKTRSR